MKWLIIEDSLEGRNGHWFEYLSCFHRELAPLGDHATWLVPKNAEPWIVDHFQAKPVLPESIYLKMSDGAPLWLRYLRIPIHSWRTFWSIRKFLRSHAESDIIFVPTVIIHHLLGWAFLIETVLSKSHSRILLFFPSLPIHTGESGTELDGSPSARLMSLLLHRLRSKIKTGKVILGVETHAMKKAAEEVFSLPFTYFPHPVLPLAPWNSMPSHDKRQTRIGLVMACYGVARHEKGSDLLVAALEQYLALHPKSKIKFALQWVDDFSRPDGSLATLPESLFGNPRVEIIDRLFMNKEYEERLAATDVLILPYRISSYNLRVSRQVIEALVNKIPAVVTYGTTLAEQAQEYGAVITCEDGDIDSLVKAIHQAEQNYALLKFDANEWAKLSQSHFSVEKFRANLLA